MTSPVVEGTQVLTALHEMASTEVKHQVQGLILFVMFTTDSLSKASHTQRKPDFILEESILEQHEFCEVWFIRSTNRTIYFKLLL